jgi:hypothetical protein
MSKMTKEEIAGLIKENLRNEINSVIENLKKDVSLIEEDKNNLFDGNKGSMGKIRKTAQSIKKNAQEVRVKMIKVRDAIAKK